MAVCTFISRPDSFLLAFFLFAIERKLLQPEMSMHRSMVPFKVVRFSCYPWDHWKIGIKLIITMIELIKCGLILGSYVIVYYCVCISEKSSDIHTSRPRGKLERHVLQVSDNDETFTSLDDCRQESLGHDVTTKPRLQKHHWRAAGVLLFLLLLLLNIINYYYKWQQNQDYKK